MNVDAHKAGCQVAKAAKLAAVITRCGATNVLYEFTAPMWRMVVELAEVNPHSADEPVSATVEAMVRALLQAQHDGILAFGAEVAAAVPPTTDTGGMHTSSDTRRVTNRINASMGFVPVDL